MSKATKRVQEELVMDLTPMIDCVFLLMIFFVLVIDLSQQELEDLILPKADYAVPDDQPPENRPVINITQSGRMIYKKNDYYDPAEDADDFSRIKSLLVLWRDNVAKEVKVENLGGRKMNVIDDPVLVRADKWTEWHYVGKFMEQCAQPEAAFWKLELALSEQDKEEKALKSQRALQGQ